MPQFESWGQNIQPLSVPTSATATQYVLLNADGFTSTVFSGTGFTYDINNHPTGGVITSMSLVVNSDATVLQTMTDLVTSPADIGSFIDTVQSLRSQITWFNVIQGGEGGPSVFTPTRILLANTDGTFTEALGSSFSILGAPTGTVTEIRHLASDGTTEIGRAHV